MNLFHTFQTSRLVPDLARSLRFSKIATSVPSMLFCVSLCLALAISPANGQPDQKNNNQKKGIMCYVCNSARDPRCGDPFDSTTIEKADCEQLMPNMNTTICRKTVQRATLGSRSDVRVVRTCGYLPEAPRTQTDEEEGETSDGNERCYNKAGTFEVQVTYCACLNDGCNHAPRQAWTSLSLVSQTTLQLLTMIAGSYLMLNKGFY